MDAVYFAHDGRIVDETEARDERGVIRSGYGCKKELFMMDSVQRDIHLRGPAARGTTTASVRDAIVTPKIIRRGMPASPAGLTADQLRDSKRDAGFYALLRAHRPV